MPYPKRKKIEKIFYSYGFSQDIDPSHANSLIDELSWLVDQTQGEALDKAVEEFKKFLDNVFGTKTVVNGQIPSTSHDVNYYGNEFLKTIRALKGKD